jgi:hypothetical protein
MGDANKAACWKNQNSFSKPPQKFILAARCERQLPLRAHYRHVAELFDRSHLRVSIRIANNVSGQRCSPKQPEFPFHVCAPYKTKKGPRI